MIDIDRAHTFMATNARLLDRRRFDLLLGEGPAEGVLAALAAYRNADGGFGWGLEPDMRGPTSQAFGALHAFEILAEAAAGGGTSSPLATELCDWLASVTLADGGVAFAQPGADTPGTAPWFAGSDTTVSSLHATAAVASHAHQLAAHDPRVAAHPWLARATAHTLDAVNGRQEFGGGAYELLYVLQFLDAVAARDDAPERDAAAAQLERLVAAFVPASGEMPVQGGVEGEIKRPLDFSPWPGRPLRRHFPADAVAAHLDTLTGEQQEDGGWTVSFPSSSTAGAVEWRGIATLGAVAVLRANGRI